MSDFKGRHFEGEIVPWAVRWYCRYGVSYRWLPAIAASYLSRRWQPFTAATGRAQPRWRVFRVDRVTEPSHIAMLLPSAQHRSEFH